MSRVDELSEITLSKLQKNRYCKMYVYSLKTHVWKCLETHAYAASNPGSALALVGPQLFRLVMFSFLTPWRVCGSGYISF